MDDGRFMYNEQLEKAAYKTNFKEFFFERTRFYFIFHSTYFKYHKQTKMETR